MTIPYRITVSVLAALLMTATAAEASRDSLVTAVYSNVGNGYKRKLDADGKPKPEYYALAAGKYLPGMMRDQSIDSVAFPKIAGTVAGFLAEQNYFFAHDAKSADLLLMITWGTTVPFDDGLYRGGLDQFSVAMNNATMASGAAQGTDRSADGIQSPASAVADAARDQLESQFLQMRMFEDIRMRSNERNANLLGYLAEINYRNNISRYAGAGSSFDDLISDIENERYYVIIAAYDFRAMAKEQKERLLWVTRVSIQKDGNKFDSAMATMLARASRFFGQESGRLLREYHEGTVTIGELRVLGIVPESDAAQDEPAPKP